MHPIAYIFMVFGGALAVTGIILFAKMGTQGTSSVKMFGFEFKLGGSALVVFVVGVMLFLVPVLYGDRLPKRSAAQRGQDIASHGTDSYDQDARFIVVDTSLKPEEGIFLTKDACVSRSTEINDGIRRMATKSKPSFCRCVPLPEYVWCALVDWAEDGKGEWSCFLSESDCDEFVADVEHDWKVLTVVEVPGVEAMHPDEL